MIYIYSPYISAYSHYIPQLVPRWTATTLVIRNLPQQIDTQEKARGNRAVQKGRIRGTLVEMVAIWELPKKLPGLVNIHSLL